jgi:hypothetical protein
MFFSPPPPPKPPLVTVYIHGTRPENNLPSSISQYATKIYAILSGNLTGLHKITKPNLPYYPVLRAKALCEMDPKRFNPEHFYLFGWSGKLSLVARKDASLELYNALKELSFDYEKIYNTTPKFILISHSHGGNVILHLAEATDSTNSDEYKLKIKKAILLACPVQKHTSHLIDSDIFKRVYSIHSHADVVQVIDPQGLHNIKKITSPFLSERHFNPQPNVIQAQVKWKKYPLWTEQDYAIKDIAMQKLIKSINYLNFFKKGRNLLHIEFDLLPFIRQLPSIINKLDDCFDNTSNCPPHKGNDVIIEL